ncbi:hypothetical protein BCU74_03850 [Vibrio breoganii]|uniref:hypothetical protein n=1 Tax=Vibrio breoganii TaxID=553239 RepID=UPI000C866716|nr:hypothetical protein [Vibrio breoganii]PMH12418.1 hypothetical protein BCU74_03850 [Vibrio breoganii]
MSKTQIAVNTKFFSRTQAKGEMAHVMRLFAEDKNVLSPELTKHNFGTSDEAIQQRYSDAVGCMHKSAKNSLIDSLLVLPYEQVKVMQEECKRKGENWRKELHVAIEKMMLRMELELGFKPVGYKMHMDEGVRKEDGTTVLNTHAHLLFANYCDKDVTLTKTRKITQKDEHGKAMRDPKKPSKWLYELDEDGKPKTEEYTVDLKDKAPLSHHQGRGKNSAWAKQQDIATEHLAHLGFTRGTSAEVTKAKHLEKDQFIEQKLQKTLIAGKKAYEDLREQVLEQKAERAVAERKAEKALQLLGGRLEKVDEFIEKRSELYERAQREPDAMLKVEVDQAVDSFKTGVSDELKAKLQEQSEARAQAQNAQNSNAVCDFLGKTGLEAEEGEKRMLDEEKAKASKSSQIPSPL